MINIKPDNHSVELMKDRIDGFEPLCNSEYQRQIPIPLPIPYKKMINQRIIGLIPLNMPVIIESPIDNNNQLSTEINSIYQLDNYQELITT